MYLSSLEKTRKSMAKLIRAYESGKNKDPVQFRNLMHAFSVFLQYWKFEKDLQIEERLTEIEGFINERQK